MKSLVLAGALVNAAVALLALGLLYLAAPAADLQMRMRFTELDRAGVINEAALDKFHPSRGFKSDHIRITVPRFLAGPLLEEAERNATLLCLLACVNFVLCVGVLIAAREPKTPS